MKPIQALSTITASAGVAVAGIVAVINLPENKASAYNAAPPSSIKLTGVVRDFVEKTKPNGHPDFENAPSAGFALYSGNIAGTIGADHNPVFTGLGWKTTTQWKDSAGRPICHLLYNPALGDTVGVKGVSNKGGVNSAATFNQWFEDVPGVNQSMPLEITFNLDSNGNYVFDDKLDPDYSAKGGFFPIDGMLFGNSGPAPSGSSPNHNFHFTFELHCMFTYYQGTGQMFKFIGDDDVFVYINGQLVIDLGGVHSAREQYVDLDRLGLTDGEIYPLDFFFAERHRTQSNCRISTNLLLNSGLTPNITSAFD